LKTELSIPLPKYLLDLDVVTTNPHFNNHFFTMASPPEPQSQETLKQTFISTLGPQAWNETWSSVFALSPEIFTASISLLSVPHKKAHLPPKIQSLISLAVSASSTHLYLPGIHQHTKAALSNGASVAEVTEVLELTATLGIHACNIGVPLLMEVLKEEGLYEEKFGAASGWTEGPERKRLREEFTKKRGYWHSFWDDFLKLDPEFFAAYLEFSTVPWIKGAEEGKVGGVLEPKIKELIYCAFDVASTHLYQPGLKLHMRNALGYGATVEEIMEVLELASLLSLHTLEVAAPVLVENMKK
jgi:alkylhydroperoxidase/carboxymuconolactone decarboxylase family protein YurZ